MPFVLQGTWWYKSIQYSADQILLDTTQLYFYFFHKTPSMQVKRKLQPSVTPPKGPFTHAIFDAIWCDFDAILRTKSAPANPARVFSHVTLRQNTTKLAEIGMKGVFKQYVITFFPIHTMLREKSIRAV